MRANELHCNIKSSKFLLFWSFNACLRLFLLPRPHWRQHQRRKRKRWSWWWWTGLQPPQHQRLYRPPGGGDGQQLLLRPPALALGGDERQQLLAHCRRRWVCLGRILCLRRFKLDSLFNGFSPASPLFLSVHGRRHSPLHLRHGPAHRSSHLPRAVLAKVFVFFLFFNLE